MKTNLLPILLSVAVMLASCKKDKNLAVDSSVATENEIKKDHSDAIENGINYYFVLPIEAERGFAPRDIIISVADTKGNVLIESKKIRLVVSSILTEFYHPVLLSIISLPVGNYIITKYLVLDVSGLVAYAVPLTGSKLSDLFPDRSLPFNFQVTEANIHDYFYYHNSTYIPGPIFVENYTSEDFGYNSFGNNAVMKFDFFANVMYFNESDANWEPTSSNITIRYANENLEYNISLAGVNNQIHIYGNSSNYTLIANKVGYQPYIITFTASDLKRYTEKENGPLMVRFQSKNPTVSDIDGNIYHTVTIGSQIWMAENLKVTKYNDGTPVPLVTDDTGWSLLTTSGHCWYDNDATAIQSNFGALYNWYTVSSGKLCPTGWHVPGDAEWSTLISNINSDGRKLKGADQTLWSSVIFANNETGFTAIPGGNRYSFNGRYGNKGLMCDWWSYNEINSENANSISLWGDSKEVSRHTENKKAGSSVRCLKD